LNQDDDKYFTDKIQNLFNLSQNLYQEMLDNNIAKECARFVLPISSETTLYVKGSLRSWITYLNVRLDEHTQLEHRDIAVEISKIVTSLFPNVSLALNNFNDNKGMFI
jgi:thymidylate synthase (FAD)